MVHCLFKITLVLGFCSTVFGLDCSKSPNNVDPDTCCKTPMLVSMEIITECLGKYGEQTKKQATLPGPKRGCVSNLKKPVANLN